MGDARKVLAALSMVVEAMDEYVAVAEREGFPGRNAADDYEVWGVLEGMEGDMTLHPHQAFEEMLRRNECESISEEDHYAVFVEQVHEMAERIGAKPWCEADDQPLAHCLDEHRCTGAVDDVTGLQHDGETCPIHEEGAA